MKNKLSDLNNHLFAQLERLGDEDMTDAELRVEAVRADAMVKVSSQIVKTAQTRLKAVALIAEYGDDIDPDRRTTLDYKSTPLLDGS